MFCTSVVLTINSFYSVCGEKEVGDGVKFYVFAGSGDYAWVTYVLAALGVAAAGFLAYRFQVVLLV